MATNNTKPTGNPATGVATYATTTANSATKTLLGAIEKFDTMVSSIPAKEEEIRLLEERKNNLTKDIQESERLAQVDLGVRIKENKDKTVSAVLAELGKVAITREELAQHETLQKEFSSEVQKNVGAAVGNAKREHEHLMKQQELVFQATSASDKSEIESLRRINAAQAAQVEQLTAQIDKDRAARIEEAKARGTGSAVVVNSGK